MALKSAIKSRLKHWKLKVKLFFSNNFRILEIDPHHVQGQHNLCVVHVERGNYIEGKTCLEKALSLAPGEQYIRNHLNIVKNKIAQLDINKV